MKMNNNYLKGLLKEEKIIYSVNDKLPVNLYIIEIGYAEKLEYISGKYWINYIPLTNRYFSSLCSARDYLKKIKNQIICNAYLKFYILRDDGDKEILKIIHGGNVFRSNFMEE